MVDPTLPPKLVRADQVKSRPVEWLWPGFIPKGKVVTLEGDPGLGKSTFTTDIGARLTNGTAMPDGSLPATSCKVLFLSAEDSPEDTIKPRLVAHGGLLEKVFFWPGDDDLSLPRGMSRLERAIVSNDIGFVVVDPLHAFLDGKVDPHRDAEIRRVLRPLMQLGDRTGVTFLLLRHLNKAVGGSAIYRGNGSIGVIAAGRSGLLMAKHPNDPEGVVLAVSKTNLSQKPKSLAFTVETSARHGCSHLAWQGEVPFDAEDLMVGQERDGKLQRAKMLLSEMLEKGDRPQAEIEVEGRQRGISLRTLEMAKSQMGIGSYSKPVEGRRGRGPSWWTNTPQPLDPRKLADYSDDDLPMEPRQRKVRKARKRMGQETSQA